MKKFDRIVLKVFLCLFPFGIGLVIVDSIFQFKSLGIFNDAVGVLILSWTFSMLYLSVKLLVSSHFRDKILTRLTFFRERDEREVLVSGRATRNSYLATLAILLFFLCLSLFRLSVYRVPDTQAVNGKTGTISLHLNLNMLGEKVSAPAGKDEVAVNYFAYPGLPLSNTAIFLFLIVWQICSYNYFVKRIESGKENMIAVEISN